MEDLKLCSFCGNEVEIGIGGYDTAREIRCPRCGCGTDYYDDSQEATEAWNRRIE
jgi:hypothetical protein